MCAHRNQRRKFEDALYMVHPIRVARIVAEYTDDANVIAAAMMHDVLEDTDVTAEEMRRVFGDAITDLVLEVTDVSRPTDGNRTMRKAKDRPTPNSLILKRIASGGMCRCGTGVTDGTTGGAYRTSEVRTAPLEVRTAPPDSYFPALSNACRFLSAASIVSSFLQNANRSSISPRPGVR